MERPRRLRGRWVAVPPGEEPEELHKVDGSVIYFDPDEEDHSPLRDASESLPTDPDWLQATLGLSPELVGDIKSWDREWKATCSGSYRLSDRDLRAEAEALDDRAITLVERMRHELKNGFEVVVRLPAWPSWG